MGNCSNWASTSEKPAWASTLHVGASPRRKPGALSFRITSGPWYRSISLPCRRSDFRFCTYSWFWLTIEDGFVHFNVTAHPTAEWTGQQLREAFPFEQVPRYLLRDRDGIFGSEFRKDVKAMGIKEVLSSPRSPWQRAYVERVIGTIRRECLDHMIVLNEASL